MVIKIFHPVVQIAVMLVLLTAIFSKNLYILGLALGLLIALRLPRGIGIKEVAVAIVLGVVVGTLHFFFKEESHTVIEMSDHYYESIRLAGIVMIIVICLKYMNNFSALEWLEISAFFPLPESFCRLIDWMAVVIVMAIRFVGMFIGVAFTIFSEFKTRPQLSAKHRISVFPGMALTYVTEVMRNVEVYSDTWDLRFGGPVLRRDSFRRSLTVLDYLAVLSLIVFIFAFARW